MEEWKEVLFDQLTPYIATTLLKSKIEGAAAKSISNRSFKKPDQLYSHLETSFPIHGYRNDMQAKLAQGEYFKSFTAENCAEEAKRLYALLLPSDATALAVSLAISKAFPKIWVFTGVTPYRINKSNFEEVLGKFQNFAEVAPPTPSLPEKHITPSLSGTTTENGGKTKADSEKTSRSALRRQRNKANAEKYATLEKQVEAQARQLKSLLAQAAKNSSSGKA